MSHARNIAKNSLWLIVQPLVLNVISIFVIGYIARTLGQMDYGKFVFAFAFVSIFVPLTNMGLDYLTTREIAENKENAGIILGKILLLRIALALIAVAVVVIVVILLGYPPNTRLIVYIAATTLLLNAVSTTVHSGFQGFEKMEYVAYSQFISGFVLTVLSVVVLFFGYRLTGLTSVYAFGNLLGMVIAIIILVKKITIPIYSIDIDYWIENAVKIKGKPQWLFIKLHTHGAVENSWDSVFGKKAERMYQHLQDKYNDGKDYVLHYVTAREIYNIVKAVEAGEKGTPDNYRDYKIPKYIYAK